MNAYLKEREAKRKREYQRKWRAEHPDSVRAAQMRYWTKKAAEMRAAAGDSASAETRNMEEPAL